MAAQACPLLLLLLAAVSAAAAAALCAAAPLLLRLQQQRACRVRLQLVGVTCGLVLLLVLWLLLVVGQCLGLAAGVNGLWQALLA